jgi:hypothetical protein
MQSSSGITRHSSLTTKLLKLNLQILPSDTRSTVSVGIITLMSDTEPIKIKILTSESSA